MKQSIKAGKQMNGGIDFSILREEEIQEIHEATLEILWRTGMYVELPEAQDLFADGGAVVDKQTGIVKIPPHMVQAALDSVPSKFFLPSRDGKHDVVLEDGRVGFTNFGEAIKVVDPVTREVREPQKKDLADCTRLLDYLEHIDVVERPMGCHEVNQDVLALHNAEALLNNTTKHIMLGPQSGALAKKIIDMVAAVAGGREHLAEKGVITFLTCPVSPLKLPNDCCEIIIEGSRAGMGVGVLSQVLCGGTGPVTIAGTLVQHNAEVLSTLVLSQLVNRGVSFMYSSSTCSLDLRLGSAIVGNPETALISAAIAQMARHYLLPVWVAGG